MDEEQMGQIENRYEEHFLNSTISIIALNENDLNTPIKW